MIPKNYVPYHVHTMLSNGVTNIDSITDFHDYIDTAKKYGMSAFAFSEHGSLFAWLKKKEYIESSGMKYIHAIEVYLTEDDGSKHIYSANDILFTAMAEEKGTKLKAPIKLRFEKYWQRDDGMWIAEAESPDDGKIKTLPIDIDTLKIESDIKTRDNYHAVLIAKNYDGVKEINKIVSKSFCRDDFHYYYTPRVSFDELFATSDNVIITSACLGGTLASGTPSAKEKFLSFMERNKHRCFLEIQHHNCKEQIKYNQLLYKLHQTTGIPLIAGTDTHALNEIHMDGRAMLQKAKGVHFSNEDAWDLTFKSIEQLIAAYKLQNSLPMEIVYEAINNTNIMADMVEEFTLDYSPKYPKLYPNSEEVFKQKINQGVKSRGIMNYPNYQEYLDRIHYEYDVYKHNGAIDFMLLEENYKSEMRKKNIKYGYSRGSVSGSIIAYLLYITEIDSVKYNLNFERFMNKERVSLADVDTDWLSEDRKAVKDYLYGKKGLYCCDIVTFNTIALKGAIRDICRALYKEVDFYSKLSPKWQKKYDEYQKSCDYYNGQGQSIDMPKDLEEEIERVSGGNYIKISEEIIAMCEIDEDAARKKYPDVFKYVDLVNGVVVSVGNHPAGCVVSPIPVDEWFGTFTTSSDEYPVSLLNMKEIDSLNFVKLDILGLDNIGLIYKTCDLAGIPFATPDNIPADDMAVWNSIKDDTTMIFQWESQSATVYLKQLFSDETIARIREKNPNFSYMDLLSIGNGAIRPAGESYRDKLAQGIYQDNGHEALNKFLAPTLGYCIEANQLVHTVDGRKKIKDIQIGDCVYTNSGVSNVTHKTFMGCKDTIRLKTQSSTLICTKDHKILSEYGWIEADKLNVGEHIAIRVGNTNTKTCEKSKLRLIGYLIGDGMLTKGNNVGFVNKDIDVVNDFSNMVKHFYNCTTSVKNRKSRVNKNDLYYVNVKHIESHKYPTSVTQYLRTIGFKKESGGGLIANEKYIPNFIFSLKTDDILQFLGAYTDTDSCIRYSNKKILRYTTVSKKLAYDIVEIFRLLGYTSYVRKDANAYLVCINNAIEALKMLYNYSFKIRKFYKFEELATDRYTTNSIKFTTIKKFIDKKLYKDICSKTGINLYAKTDKSNISIKSIKRLKEDYNFNIPDYLFNDNIIWLPIIEKKHCGYRNVYDLTIANEHNFVCENIVVHNCVYQEQVIEFLHSFCGYSMGEADIVRRGFAKKTGTEKFIPKIKAGFTQTMMDKYNVSSEESDTLILNFIKVIEDASSYLFSKNHADPYSWIGYICGYLRYYYPLEFITTALNIFEGKEEKSLAIIDYAKKQGITISPIKFRHSIAKYSFDKETNQIFKGISSIKYMNTNVADEMYALRNNKYNTFIDLLYDLKDKTSINSRQLKILVELDFFEEFGDTNYLLRLINLYEEFGGKVQIKKDKLDNFKISYDLVRPFAEKETEKMFTKIYSKGLLSTLAKQQGNIKRRTLKEKVAAQIEHLGYLDIADARYSRMLAIISIDTKYSPRLKVYSLKNGTMLDCKIDKRTYSKKKLEKGDIIKVTGQNKKPKTRRTEAGTYEPIPGTSEIWLTGYEKVENV
ncbi:MAG: PHP domain-containing protein [Erysipelotrichaceae bacterium]|nr:PHP domain-containing protein [Erysipelotrichaceae bacterium]